MAVSFQGGHGRASVNLDVVDLLDAVHEVSRHALAQILAARDDVHPSRMSRQRHDGLPSRIAGAHDDDLLVATELRFRVRRGIADARTLELTQTGHIKPAILHTRRDKDGLATNPPTVGERDNADAGVVPETLDSTTHRHPPATLLPLHQHAPPTPPPA